jgi:hypothetical protein
VGRGRLDGRRRVGALQALGLEQQKVLLPERLVVPQDLQTRASELKHRSKKPSTRVLATL